MGFTTGYALVSWYKISIQFIISKSCLDSIHSDRDTCKGIFFPPVNIQVSLFLEYILPPLPPPSFVKM